MNSEIDAINQTISGAGARWVNLRTKNDGVLDGTIISVNQRQKTFEGEVVLSRKSKQPRIEWVFTLQTDTVGTDDDGVRKYAANEWAQQAITTTLKEGRQKLAIGGRLKIAVIRDPETSTDHAEYKARYEPPAAPLVSADDIFGDDGDPF